MLVLPQRPVRHLAQRVVIAWNQSPEAAAAVTAALPLLKLAERVVLVSSGRENRVGPRSSQLSQYLERTVYVVRDGKSFIYKFNCRNRVYYAIEPWIDEIVKSFFEPVPTHTAKGLQATDANPS